MYNPKVLDLNDMAVFARVVREGSFTAAARALGLPKSTVSQRVARLEVRLGVRLLHRTTRSVRATDAGAAYAERCARILSEAEEADAAATESHAAIRGRVRLATPELFAHAFLPAVIPEFLRHFPETELDVVIEERHVDLVREGLDLAVRVGRVGDAQLVSRRLGVAHHVLCASPRHARERGLPLAPADLRDAECVLYDLIPVPQVWRLERGREVVRIRPRGRLTVSSVTLAHKAALDGIGVASLPTFVCAADLEARRLVPVLPGWTTLHVPIQVVYPSRRHLPGRVRALIDLLVARYAAAPPWAIPVSGAAGKA